MARVIDAEKLLTIFAKKHPETKISVKISDPSIEKNNAVFVMKNGKVSKKGNEISAQFNVEIDTLTQVLLGYKTAELSKDYSRIFPEKQPMIGFMME